MPQAAPEAQKLKAFAESLASSIEFSKGESHNLDGNVAMDMESQQVLQLDRAL